MPVIASHGRQTPGAVTAIIIEAVRNLRQFSGHGRLLPHQSSPWVPSCLVLCLMSPSPERVRLEP